MRRNVVATAVLLAPGVECDRASAVDHPIAARVRAQYLVRVCDWIVESADRVEMGSGARLQRDAGSWRE